MNEQEHDPQVGPPTTPARPVSRSGLGWVQDSRDPAAPAPGAGASLQARAAVQQASAPTPGRRAAAVAGGCAVAAGVVVLLAVRGAAGVVTGLVVAVVVAAVVMTWLVRARLGFDAAGRELRRRLQGEMRVGADLELLAAAGWVTLHDRLVSAHRVPHLVIGAPGMVLVYPYLFSPWSRARVRAARVVSGVRRRVLRRAGGDPEVVPAAISDTALDTIAWARDTLVVDLDQYPTLHGWDVPVFALHAMLDRPPGSSLAYRPEFEVGFQDVRGGGLRRYLEAEMAGGLRGPAIKHLAGVVDEPCPPALTPSSGGAH